MSNDAELICLGAELEAMNARLMESKEQGLVDGHFALRAKIDAIPAQTMAGRSVKRRAIEMAICFDVDFESAASGSFVSLSQSLARDALAAMPALAARSLISRLPPAPPARIAA